jgi:hypothetical protein
MEWLVTFKKNVAPEEIQRLLTRSGCDTGAGISPLPLDDVEQVVNASGPADLPQRLASEEGVVNVYPNSSLELY